MLIDKIILRKVRRKKRCLSVVWIDYRKVYDVVPYSWVTEMVELVKVAGNVKGILTSCLRDWRTVLFANGLMLGEVEIRRGISEVILFCLFYSS